ncbi:Peptidase family M1 [Desulfonispora thiosulfatigenes DSM 11270]|uniref:Peptidase family M1 n=1 Tax=Desulfonispora thiosulfatigenes DSM 11270 TaxID=656914 RepID=A0A1W1UMB4_DESTI|nr:M1 family aminopeptidase [Desulfonispora thiosulfatigenes]SMB82210.1 Peptidase family M1 [Desulfonispora thiosulfatigenes DSM 11270]
MLKKTILVLVYTLVAFFILNMHSNFKEKVNSESYPKQGYIYSLYNKQDNENVPQYKLKSKIYKDKMIVTEMMIKYKNNYDFLQSDLRLILPANILYEDKYINILNINTDKKSKYEENNNEINIYFDKGLFPKEKVNIYVKFTTFLPDQAKMMGSHQGVNMLSNWYPAIPPFDEKKKEWLSFIKSDFGEPYFYPAANFFGTITAPTDFDIITPYSISENVIKETKTITFDSKLPVRDFTIVYGTGFKKKQKNVQGTQVVYCYLNKNRNALPHASASLEYYNSIYGKYPYEQLVLVDVPLDNLYGMEFSGMLFLSTIHDQLGEKTIAHEVAHQYWYSLVCSDQANEPWIDESLATYSSLLYLENKYGHYYYDKEIKRIIKKNITYSSLDSILNYSDKEMYTDAIYHKSILFWDNIRNIEGKTKLINYLTDIQTKYRYNIIDTHILFKNILRHYPELNEKDLYIYLQE